MKKSIVLLLVLAMVLSLCACAKEDTTTSTTKPTASSAESTSPSTPAEPSTPSEPDVLEGNFFVISQIDTRNVGNENITTQKVIYDADYNIIGLQVYDNDWLSHSNTYDKSLDKPLLEQEYDSDGNVHYCKETAYNEDGTILAEYGYLDGEKIYECVYTYNEHGDMLTRKYQDFVDAEENWTQTYEHTYEGDKLTQTKIDYNNHLQLLYQYDSDGNIITEERYCDGLSTKNTYENGKLVLSITSVHTELGDIVEQVRDEYTYDADGDILNVIRKRGDEVTSRKEYVYNDAGLLTEITDCDADSKKVVTYGEDGSPITLKIYDGETLTREITFTSQKVTISEEQMEQLTSLYAEFIKTGV